LHDLAGAMPVVHQPLDGAQLFHLLAWVDSLAKGIAFRVGKAVSALPDPQGVLGKAGVPLHRTDTHRLRLTGTGGRHGPDVDDSVFGFLFHHFVQDISIDKHFMRPYITMQCLF